MTKPQLHFDINIPVTFLAQKKEAMTTPECLEEKREKENCLTRYCLCSSLDL